MRVIKTAILVDIMGHGYGEVTPEMEVEEHAKRYAQYVAPDVLDVYAPSHMGEEMEHGIKFGTELLLYDYGGMGFGSSLMESNAREAVKWAENHPNALLIVVSGFTYRNFIRYEMEEQGLLELPNIICDDSSALCPIPEWWLGHPCGEEQFPEVYELNVPGKKPIYLDPNTEFLGGGNDEVE